MNIFSTTETMLALFLCFTLASAQYLHKIDFVPQSLNDVTEDLLAAAASWINTNRANITVESIQTIDRDATNSFQLPRNANGETLTYWSTRDFPVSAGSEYQGMYEQAHVEFVRVIYWNDIPSRVRPPPVTPPAVNGTLQVTTCSCVTLLVILLSVCFLGCQPKQ